MYKDEFDKLQVPEAEGIDMYLAAAAEPVSWVVNGLIADGDQVLLAGAPKVGKSLMALQIALAVASGGRFMGLYAPRPRKVLYFNFEVKKRLMGQRVEMMMRGNRTLPDALRGNLKLVSGVLSMDVLDAQALVDFLQLIAREKPDLVVWDVLSRMHGMDEVSSDMKAVMLAIRGLSAGAAHIVVHHTRKGVPGSDRVQRAHDIRGSSAIHGEADLALVLSRRAGQGARYNLAYSARGIMTPDDQLLNLDEKTLLFYEAGVDDERQLLDVLTDAFNGKPTIPARDLIDAIRGAFVVGERQAKNYLSSAHKAQWVQRRREGRAYMYDLIHGGPILHTIPSSGAEGARVK